MPKRVHTRRPLLSKTRKVFRETDTTLQTCDRTIPGHKRRGTDNGHRETKRDRRRSLHRPHRICAVPPESISVTPSFPLVRKNHRRRGTVTDGQGRVPYLYKVKKVVAHIQDHTLEQVSFHTKLNCSGTQKLLGRQRKTCGTSRLCNITTGTR